MTVDDLAKVFRAGLFGYLGQNPYATVTEGDRAGVTAIVRALRDEIATIAGWSGAKGRIGEVLNEILGSDAGEKVGGGARRDADHEAKAPPTDPAPAVCDIKELAVKLRKSSKHFRHEAADALEALAGEVERLKGVLELIKRATRGGPDHVSDDDITAIFHAARSALEAKP